MLNTGDLTEGLTFDDVLLEPEGIRVGSVNEDFALESMAGDIFQLGNQSYSIRRVEAGKVRVEDARGAPPTIPFWLGEAPARTPELSHAVSDLRREVALRLVGSGVGHGFDAVTEAARDTLTALDTCSEVSGAEACAVLIAVPAAAPRDRAPSAEAVPRTPRWTAPRARRARSLRRPRGSGRG